MLRTPHALGPLAPLALTLVLSSAGALARAGDPPAPPNQSPEAAPSAPADGPLLVIADKNIDFGEAIHGKTVLIPIAIENRGKQALELKQVKPSCGCTIATHPDRLAPGEKGTIQLSFDSSKRAAGYQSFRVAIYSNDATQRDLGAYCTLVNVRGEVRTLYRLSPHGAYFGEFIQGLEGSEQGKKTVSVVGVGEAHEGFGAKLVTPLPDYLDVEVTPLPESVGKKGHQISVRMLPHAPLGQIELALEFETGIPVQPRFQIQVTALVSSRITGPQGVQFGDVPRAEGGERLLPLERRDGVDGIPIAQVDYDRTRLELSMEVITAQRTDVTVKVKPNAPPGPFATYVTFFLDEPTQRILRVPVFGEILPRVRCEPPLLLVPPTAEKGALLGVVVVRPEGGTVTGVRLEPASVGTCRRVGPKIEVVATGGTIPADARLVLQTDVAGEEQVAVPLVLRR